jgi:sugar phosphate isomerase/epimerase
MDQQNHMCRRELLMAGAAGALLAGFRSAPVQAASQSASRNKKPGIAVQLYSVRGDCAKDFDKALAQVAKMGFDAVEFAGYHTYSNNPEGLRKRLDELGLKVAATHIGTGTIEGDALAKTIDFHQTIGCKYLCVPGDGRFWDPQGSKELAAIFNKADEKLQPLGMACGYHNHKNEFKKDGNKTYWDLFAERTSRGVILQQDVGWTVAAGQDPAALIRKYPGRSKVIHCKPTVVGEGTPILGQDSVPWVSVFKACETVGGTEWYTLEQERYLPDVSPMECTYLSLAGLKAILNNT